MSAFINACLLHLCLHSVVAPYTISACYNTHLDTGIHSGFTLLEFGINKMSHFRIRPSFNSGAHLVRLHKAPLAQARFENAAGSGAIRECR